MTQVNREKIYNMMSPRILERKARRAAAFEKKAPEKTIEVDNAVTCDSTVAVSLNVKTGEQELLISPNEGKPAVNGQAERVNIQPVGKQVTIDPGIAVIPQIEKKKPGRPKKNKTDE